MDTTIEYVKLNPSTLQPDESGIYYKVITQQNGAVSKQAFNETKTETQRINNNTVVDVVYAFDFESEAYVETSRVSRNEPLPPTPKTLAELEAENTDLKARLGDVELFIADMIGGI